MKISQRLIVTAATLAALAGCATTPSPATVNETTAAKPELSTLNKLVKDAGLAETLGAAGPYTVFAPSDAAFMAVPAKTMQEMASDKELLRSVLSYHVVASKVLSADVKNGPAKTLQGGNISLSKAGSFVTVEDAVVTQADLPASNGVVHVIDRVLIPAKR
ncbi:fasciclin domain-containing protein [Piscinibacter sp. XHJ-5]|uniref:fasciclin domain-containing protein n=1 Tax=Piscinibacter sp. XHJ-5 TaxID=3037797 RepID=UPI002452B0E5|nr:fasciclin domain-containing protein [Piscinibacter sp. XHJ-5]